MRNLLLFLQKNYYFFFFLFLEFIAVFLLVQNNKYQNAGFANSSNMVTGSVYATWSGMTDYLSLKQSNELLAEENARLRTEAKNAMVSYAVKPVNVSDSVYKQQYSFITAKVVNNSTNRRNNYLTLNRGAQQGVKKGMAVICGQGVVGIVKEVSDNFSSVMSVLHKDVNIPSALRRFGENTIVQWDGSDYRIGKMDNVPSHLKVVKGDTVVTSAYSSVFPEGIMVGTVEEIIPVQGNTFNNVKVHFSTDFRKLSYVYVVNNLLREEQEKLENETLSKDKSQ